MCSLFGGCYFPQTPQRTEVKNGHMQTHTHTHTHTHPFLPWSLLPIKSVSFCMTHLLMCTDVLLTPVWLWLCSFSSHLGSDAFLWTTMHPPHSSTDVHHVLCLLKRLELKCSEKKGNIKQNRQKTEKRKPYFSFFTHRISIWSMTAHLLHPTDKRKTKKGGVE
jgi:hypothetical protein